MVVGIDVYHDPGGQNSWVGVAATINAHFTRYFSDVADQRAAHREAVDFLKVLFARALRMYHRVRQ